MASTEVPRMLWKHSNPEGTKMFKLMMVINEKFGLHLKTFWDLYQFSVNRRADFWAIVFESCNLLYTGTYTQVVDESKPIDSIPRWFDGIYLSLAELYLWSRRPDDPTNYHGLEGKEDNKIAVTEVREGASETRHLSWGGLRRMTAQYASSFSAAGVRKGDRIVIVGSNSIDTLAIFLATTWLGAVFSSSSTDMGVQGILQRATQLNPKYIFMDDAALYNGARWDLRSKMREIVEGMKGCDQFQGLISIRRFREALDISDIQRAQKFEDFLKKRTESVPDIVRIAFHEPYLICFSSGTTGIPKAIVHSLGGANLNYFKESIFHENAGPETVTLQYTTTGWIMYLAAVGQLAVGARVVLYDGSPFQPDPQTFVRIIGEQKVTKLGISPRWMLELAKLNLSPRELTDLSNLRVVTSTGMVLSEQLFEWFYDKGFPKHVHLSNISGGTDIAGCFAMGNPLTPVYVGGTQGPSLGVRIGVYDTEIPDGPGKEVPDGTPGELGAPISFPNVPVCLWGDSKPNEKPGPKFHSSYFARFDHIWAHGDFCVIHPVTKNITFLGRSDGVLNPSGVRFGSAEIYAVMERNFLDRVVDSICVGQRRPQDEDERVILFLLMKPGHKLDSKLQFEIKEAIKKELSKRHVPRFIFETPEIPTTATMKKVELPVKQIVSGRIIKPSSTLLNPDSLQYYYQFAELEKLVGAKEKL